MFYSVRLPPANARRYLPLVCCSLASSEAVISDPHPHRLQVEDQENKIDLDQGWCRCFMSTLQSKSTTATALTALSCKTKMQTLLSRGGEKSCDVFDARSALSHCFHPYLRLVFPLVSFYCVSKVATIHMVGKNPSYPKFS